jgi:hypothetical protein
MPLASTRTAQVDRTPDGIVVVRINAGAVQSIQDAQDNIAAAAQARGQGLAPILVDIRGSAPLDAETRHYYSGKQLTDYFTALGLLVPIGAFGKMFGNVYLRVAKPGIPAKLFNSEEEAMTWLRSQLR